MCFFRIWFSQIFSSKNSLLSTSSLDITNENLPKSRRLLFYTTIMSKRARETEPVTVLEKRYAIEVIVAARRTDESLLDDSNDPESEWFGFGWDYQIKWEGYPDNENTWEPFEHIRNCLSQVVEFWEDAGHDTLLVNVPDFEVHARPEWLRKHRSSPMPTASTPKKTVSNIFGKL
ncbi:hypothetical protein B0H19DRAFT_22607 [Mycena capillaripes]|nr:hypothetical protein B0H19DRAFT_22607 [Mycena capillaripes]